ncbi:DNA-directed RNA polymerase subunit beta [Streptococcus macacae]|uniref:DNA-directed RNA polymerase, beta subunit n=1 Tax=Streptococcus macacae NCTC 11558 TaxID=764298 RepID=G5JWI5_9STRE|nr:DNA-directed RNA polymerase subunit beta [Streptococcus macacae]EHJ51638.1 DNA-directed RNA polymerase, beta subunit [Streptococcus macacae NCTC 11558]SUN78764.1 EpuA family protein [Streptococcus macacae NCTC 11558]
MNSGWKYVRNQLAFLLLLALLGLVFLALGLMIGYSFIGEGKDPLSVLSWDKWQSIINKFTGK